MDLSNRYIRYSCTQCHSVSLPLSFPLSGVHCPSLPLSPPLRCPLSLTPCLSLPLPFQVSIVPRSTEEKGSTRYKPDIYKFKSDFVSAASLLDLITVQLAPMVADHLWNDGQVSG